ncbi:hypothetical protein EA796_17625 [Pseudomonas sp. AOB-7]|uniref:hypothetical protein n=1 Tax=unclassified Pseudomonas TaxID=196821 RepID=UPI0003986767|nr:MULTISPECIES: hypothetical protein [unclassified Pseudomonas]ERI51698.1 hypothetical protein N878_06150 [Pseudomonas sp. EGD-AK9]RMH82997.1 hypothetical protein EA796_17625 [Pseudomonas sp. AOB-7]
MPPEERRFIDLPPPDDKPGSQGEFSAARPESGATPFPLFSDTPFMSWHLLHRKLRELEHFHPSCKPVIKLWDEANGA